MCHSRVSNSKINWLHDKNLRIVYNDKQYLFNELLEKDSQVLVHIRNIQFLATEMYKLINSLTPPIINIIVNFKLISGIHCNLKVLSCKLYYNKYMIASTQIANTEIFTFISVLVFKLLSRKILFINIKDNRNY